MSIRKLNVEFECKTCKKKETSWDHSFISSHNGELETVVQKANILPREWISLEWLWNSEHNGEDFCSLSCMIKYFKKKEKGKK